MSCPIRTTAQDRRCHSGLDSVLAGHSSRCSTDIHGVVHGRAVFGRISPARYAGVRSDARSLLADCGDRVPDYGDERIGRGGFADLERSQEGEERVIVAPQVNRCAAAWRIAKHNRRPLCTPYPDPNCVYRRKGGTGETQRPGIRRISEHKCIAPYDQCAGSGCTRTGTAVYRNGSTSARRIGRNRLRWHDCIVGKVCDKS